jgi:hypothetical protein
MGNSGKLWCCRADGTMLPCQEEEGHDFEASLGIIYSGKEL